MALVDGDGISENHFHDEYLGHFGRQPPKLGVARSNRARVTIYLSAQLQLSPKLECSPQEGRDTATKRSLAANLIPTPRQFKIPRAEK
jgi:hypothetical protein